MRVSNVFSLKAVIVTCFITSAVTLAFIWRDTIKSTIRETAIPNRQPNLRPIPQFRAYGSSQCYPASDQELIEASIDQHAACRMSSPFTTSRARVATVTAHFGGISTAYQKALRTHLLHSLIHGTEVRTMCDPIVDDLWNKPAFILDLLMEEMFKPAQERLEWIMWVDRDTMILDQCRPMSSFLPPTTLISETHTHRDTNKWIVKKDNAQEINLLVTEDWNGLNNGVFMLRVSPWAISLFTDILAFKDYRPDVPLRFTEQSAMEFVMREDRFRNQTEIVPQYWFNAYDQDGATSYAYRQDETDLREESVRRGDYLVHFAGMGDKATLIEEYDNVLGKLGNVWAEGTVQRDISSDITDFWESLATGDQ